MLKKHKKRRKAWPKVSVPHNRSSVRGPSTGGEGCFCKADIRTEQGRFRGFLPQSFSDYRGKIAAVFFTGGCNFRCRFCYNRQLVEGFTSLPSIGTDEALRFLVPRKGFLDAVVITGGEPTLHDWLPDFIRKVRTEGFLVGLDTNGTNPRMVESLLSNGDLDRIAADYKAPRGRYSSVTRAAPAVGDLVFETMVLLARLAEEYEVRLTLHPDLQSEDDIRIMAGELRTAGIRKIALQQFKPWDTLDQSLDGGNLYSEEDLKRFRSLFEGDVVVR